MLLSTRFLTLSRACDLPRTVLCDTRVFLRGSAPEINRLIALKELGFANPKSVQIRSGLQCDDGADISSVLL